MLGLIGIVLVLSVLAFVAGSLRALTLARAGTGRILHSRASYHGGFLAIMTAVPALFVLAFWAFGQPMVVEGQVDRLLPPEVQSASALERSVIMGQIKRVWQNLDALSDEEKEAIRSGEKPPVAVLLPKGIPVSGVLGAYTIDAAETYAKLTALAEFWRLAVVLGVAILCFFIGYTRLKPEFRARNHVERAILVFLIVCSTIAILTTVGIVLSMLSESIDFFSRIPPASFFFGTVWDPRFGGVTRAGAEGQFGLIPLLWGTLYISLIAMLVAVPIGLNAAIFLSEYASKRVRFFAKPLLELLAGIPTIVYGFFAIVTVGPVVKAFGAWLLPLFGLEAPTSASSVLTAGIVMGMMIIPFVSSLSDDIINAVPQSLRDGSYGLGATQSETIKRVILPAALPGIVGAILLAVSRAIGETMIVVMAAGVAATISPNPFESMTTITVKIVSQLTGDTEFTSPQTLVAFALGLTLFAVTLVLNVIALQIVRHYREQYE